MTLPEVVSRNEWLAARRTLLDQEKAAMRAQDSVTAQRRELPMVRMDKEYLFEGPAGRMRLVDLFEGRRQLIVYHFMWHNSAARARGDQSMDEGCASCSFTIDSVGRLDHLHASDTTFVLVSRAPLAKIETFKARMGWTIPWYSSAGSDFNYDFHVTNDESVAPVEFNYKDKATLERSPKTAFVTNGDGQALSVFVRDDESVFHTYTTYGRGTEFMMSTYQLLDLTPMPRPRYVNQWPYHDTYGSEANNSHHC
ncbi:DUF899 domain-containing protein [Actinophytocola oryzae]|uniref:Putative dithiol-disulfide oxidoreductase (DUF899 family) n=1 Tax=Actinophytocola oryzae TaxID=502181 RepID=A0A4V3FRN6_9PSEU|nr:DUF899 domain-containing protein [Actinophytocola oryzae]TDV44221.1 putative dithiol-disulfide oxidoreductase (DUF899 family) [Actinophytocola oryzae]